MQQDRNFGLVVIGDEILSGKRLDKHFAKVAELMGARDLRLSWVRYLPDDQHVLAETFRQTMAEGQVVFSCGGVGNTPDDFTRQAVAEALGVDLVLAPDAEAELVARFGNDLDDRRRLLGTFPRGSAIIPNPFNRIPGFMVREHYFVPGFPQMAHPMIEWALETFYADLFHQTIRVDKAFLLTGEGAYESALLDLMQRIVDRYPDLRLFSLPSMVGQERRHLELGVEGELERVDQAMEEIRQEVERRGITWVWRIDSAHVPGVLPA